MILKFLEPIILVVWIWWTIISIFRQLICIYYVCHLIAVHVYYLTLIFPFLIDFLLLITLHLSHIILSSHLFFTKSCWRYKQVFSCVLSIRSHTTTMITWSTKTLRFLKFGYWKRLSELRYGMAGRTVTGVTGCHRSFSEI